MDLKKIYLSREGRLPRLKFFLYLLLVGLVFSLVNNLLARIFPYTIAMIINALLQLGLLVFIYPSLVYKRQHDRGLDGKKKMVYIWIVFVVMYVISLVANTINVNVLTSIQSEAQQYAQQLQSATTTGDQAKIIQEYQIFQQKAMTEMFTPMNITVYLATFGFCIRFIILRIPLLFAAGTKGHNHYGPDPLEKKKKK